MKNNLLTSVLAIAVVVLYILHFASDSDMVKTAEVSEVLNDSTAIVNDSSAQQISLSDTTMLDSLKEASFSKIGFINMFKVVELCPALRNDLKNLENQQVSLQRKEAQIYKDFENYKLKKQTELERMQKNGLLDEMTYKMEMKEMAEKQAEAEQKVMDLRPKAEQLQRSQAKVTERRNVIVQAAIDEINAKLKLDYVLVQDGMSTSVFPLNANNDITDQIILVINKNKK